MISAVLSIPGKAPRKMLMTKAARITHVPLTMPKDEPEQESASLDSSEEEEDDIGRRESRARVPLRVVVSNVGDDHPNPSRRVHASKKAARKPLRMPTGVNSENSPEEYVERPGVHFFRLALLPCN